MPFDHVTGRGKKEQVAPEFRYALVMLYDGMHPAVPFGTAAFETVPFGTVVNEWRVHLTLVTCD